MYGVAVAGPNDSAYVQGVTKPFPPAPLERAAPLEVTALVEVTGLVERAETGANRGPFRTLAGSRTRTELVAELVLSGVERGLSLSAAARGSGVNPVDVYDWAKACPAFAAAIERAKDVGGDAVADEALAIVDGKEDSDPRSRKNRAEFRLKLLAKTHPAKFGDRIQIDSRNANVAIALSADPQEAARQYAALMGRTE